MKISVTSPQKFATKNVVLVSQTRRKNGLHADLPLWHFGILVHFGILGREDTSSTRRKNSSREKPVSHLRKKTHLGDQIFLKLSPTIVWFVPNLVVLVTQDFFLRTADVLETYN